MTDTALQLETGAMPESGAVRLWGGRFAAEPAVEMDRLNRSLPVDHRLWREERILAAARAGQTAAEMLPTVYDDVPAMAYPLAERQILAHLTRLRRAGRLA